MSGLELLSIFYHHPGPRTYAHAFVAPTVHSLCQTQSHLFHDSLAWIHVRSSAERIPEFVVLQANQIHSEESVNTAAIITWRKSLACPPLPLPLPRHIHAWLHCRSRLPTLSRALFPSVHASCRECCNTGRKNNRGTSPGKPQPSIPFPPATRNAAKSCAKAKFPHTFIYTSIRPPNASNLINLDESQKASC